MKLSQILDILPPLDDLRDLAGHLLDRGQSPAEVADDIAAMLDAVVDWTKLVPGIVGSFLESQDGPIIRAIIRVIVGQVARGKRS